jgi:outer membrane receptor protein involved in Fe transport
MITFKKRAFVTTSTIAIAAAATLAGGHTAYAQTPAAQAAQAGAVEEVIVTGTRIVRDGYEAPTPLTVVGVEQVQQSATNNTIDYLTTLPSFAGNYTPQSSTQNVSTGTAGTSSVNLRNLGTTRTLVLINGQRSVPSTITGLVDVNTIPSQLIERVDIVTGGASAAYGSDAVSGVVNFILDTKFTGLKGEVSGGVTTYGDDRSWKVALTGGTAFANDRGHFIVSGSISHQDGVLDGGRAWNNTGLQIITNPAYGTGAGQSTGVPQRLLLDKVSLSNATPGGIIVSGPLKGIAFGAGGQPYQFNYGSIVSGSAMSGGDWLTSNLHTVGQSIEPSGGQRNLFARASYQVTDDIEVFLQTNWYENSNFSNAYPNDNYFGGLTIRTDNAYLPAAVRTQAQALGLTTITMGTSLTELGPNSILTKHKLLRNVVGANGKLDALDTTWTWNAYFQSGVSMSSESSLNTLYFPGFTAAVDAVVNPANGSIVCRSTLTAPNNGCVPYNVFGTGVASAASKQYVVGISHRNQRFVQNVEAASITGEPFSSWAGPVSVALGIEHRNEKAVGSSTALDKQRVFFAGNYLPTFGSYTVTEGFAETVIPLAKDTAWAKSLDLNAAVRGTSYSTSGYVTTWKVGATYTPIDDVTFRATRSRDIRAPNLNDLYNAGSTTNQNVIDTGRTGQTIAYLGTTRGNAALQPEKADTTGVGVVLQPQFFPGFSTSVDYWNIDLAGAISTISAQNIVDLCSQGATAFCQAVNNGQPLNPVGGSAANQINIQPFNLAQQLVRGIDLEASYRTPLSAINADWDGSIGFRVLSTFFLKNYTNNTLTPPTDGAGQNTSGTTSVPDYRMTVSATYSNDRISATLTDRIVSSGVYNNTYVVCASGCPVSTTANNTINNNHIDGAMYFDLALSYKFLQGENGSNSELFLNIKNITNKDPVLVAGGPSGVPYDTVTTNPSNYDTLGRVFRLGVRFKM